MNASLREIITPGMAQRDMSGDAKHTALVLGGWLSLFPRSLSVVYIIFPARGIVSLLDEIHNRFNH